MSKIGEAIQRMSEIEPYIKAINRLRKENEKLLSLILLTDKSVSNELMNDLSLKQYAEYTKFKNELESQPL